MLMYGAANIAGCVWGEVIMSSVGLDVVRVMSLLDVVWEFVVLSGMSVWGGDIPRARELMVELKGMGFSSGEISGLSGGRWSGTVVRQYWGSSGVVDVSEKSRVMGALRGLAASRCTVEDVERFRDVNDSIRRKESTPEEVAELNANMDKLSLKPGEVGEMLELSSARDDAVIVIAHARRDSNMFELISL